MKKGITILITCSVVLFAASRLCFAQEVGRYQLVQVKYPHYDVNQNTSTQNEDLFLFDTTTGEIQAYYSQVKNGKQTKAWMPAIFDETKN